MTVAELTTLVPPLRQGRAAAARPPAAATPDDLARFFRENYPLLLDGAGGALPRRAFLDGSIPHNAPGHLPQAVLREALERVHSAPRPETPAGGAVIGPKAARVWWDRALLLERENALPPGFERPRPVLRFFDVTGTRLPAGDGHEPGSLPEAGDCHETFDIDVDLAAGGKTVQFWRSARTYAVALGFLGSDGAFTPLARAGLLFLPRDCPGTGAAAGLVRSNFRPGSREDGRIVPDAAALAWAAARPDFPTRDLEAELTLHMLYRSFLAQGPGALRRRVALARREDDVLAAEYAARRAGGTTEKTRSRKRPAFLVAVLDQGRRAAETANAYSPAVCAPAMHLPAAPDFAWLNQLLTFARSRPAAASLFSSPMAAGLVQPLAASRSGALHAAAEPVFQAADSLRASLAGLRAGAGGVTNAARGEEGGNEEAPRQQQPYAPQPHAPANNPLVPGGEPARLARAGVRVTRLSLSIEGRMRPGARLKVAGKLVSADADGNFRLECLLTGRRAAIPLRSGDAVSSINVNWEKRPIRTKNPY